MNLRASPITPGYTGGAFTWNVRVYYEDTDAGGVVYYANYVKFFERARTEWLRTIGVSQHELAASHGILFMVHSTSVDYHSPARLDDELKLSVTVERAGRASMQFFQQAWQLGTQAPQLLASSYVKVACVRAADLRPVAIPPDILKRLQAAT